MPHGDSEYPLLRSRRAGEIKSNKTIVKVFAKCPLLDHGGQIPMRGCDEADIEAYAYGCCRASRILAPNEALRLKFERYIADLIKSSTSSASSNRPVLGDRACKRSFFRWPNSSLSRRPRGNRGTVQFHECLFAAIAQLMYCTHNQFLAGARLSQDHTPRCNSWATTQFLVLTSNILIFDFQQLFGFEGSYS